MISGSHIELTSKFLQRVINEKLSIMHFTELKDSIYRAKNDVYIGRNPLVTQVLNSDY